jgi:hypothetical protein
VSAGRDITYPSFDVDGGSFLSYGFLHLGNLLTIIDTYTVAESIFWRQLNCLENGSLKVRMAVKLLLGRGALQFNISNSI